MLGNTREHFSPMQKQWNHQPKAQKCKTMALTRPPKGHLLEIWETQREECCLIQPLLRMYLSGDSALPRCGMSASDCKSSWVLILEVQINFSIQANQQVRNLLSSELWIVLNELTLSGFGIVLWHMVISVLTIIIISLTTVKHFHWNLYCFWPVCAHI